MLTAAIAFGFTSWPKLQRFDCQEADMPGFTVPLYRRARKTPSLFA
jgi:hypothetical protein